MYKLLINSPSGEQIIEHVELSGSYYDQSKVLWDERTQGEMPPIEPGKMQLIGGSLIASEDYLPAHVAATYAKTVPVEVPMAAAREALIDAGLHDIIDNYIKTLSAKDQIWWEFSQHIHRLFPLVGQVKTQLNMTDAQIDQLFIAAEQIRKQRAGEI